MPWLKLNGNIDKVELIGAGTMGKCILSKQLIQGVWQAFQIRHPGLPLIPVQKQVWQYLKAIAK